MRGNDATECAGTEKIVDCTRRRRRRRSSANRRTRYLHMGNIIYDVTCARSHTVAESAAAAASSASAPLLLLPVLSAHIIAAHRTRERVCVLFQIRKHTYATHAAAKSCLFTHQFIKYIFLKCMSGVCVCEYEEMCSIYISLVCVYTFSLAYSSDEYVFCCGSVGSVQYSIHNLRSCYMESVKW